MELVSAADSSKPTAKIANTVTIGARVQKARKAKKLSQFDLAVAAGTDTSTIHRIEVGKQAAGVATLAAVAGALGLTLDELVKP